MSTLKKISYIFLIFVICGISVSVVVFGYKANKEKQNDDKEKVSSEIKYMESQIENILNDLNNIKLTNYEISVKSIIPNKNNESSTSQQSEGGSQGESSEEASSAGESSSKGGSSGESSGGSSNEESLSGQESQSKTKGNQERYEMELRGVLHHNSDDINWENIKSTIENLYAVQSTITLDLYAQGIEQNDIVEFNARIDNLTKAAQEENKQKALNELAIMYSYLPKYFEKLDLDQEYLNLLQTKTNIFYAYSLLDLSEWNMVMDCVNNAITEYSKIMSSIKENEKSHKINKAFILLNELKNSIDMKDKEIFLIKYKNILEELKTL